MRAQTFIVSAMLLTGCLAAVIQNKNKLIVVAMSGLRHDYVDWPGLPNFEMLKQQGTHAKQLEIPFITNSWPSLFTISTGLWPDQHGIIDESMFDPILGRSFKAGVTKLDTTWAPYKPVWISAEEDGIKTVVSGWPGAELAYNQVQSTYTHPFVYAETQGQAETRIDQFLSYMIGDAQMGFIFLTEPDNTAHETGAESAATKSAVQRSDALLGRILSRLDQYDMTNTTNVLVMGDHGMTDHSSDKVIYLSDYGVGLGDMEWFTNTMFSSGMILPRESNSAQQIYDKLQVAEAKVLMTTYYKSDLPEEFHMKYHRRTSPLVIVPKIGYRIELTRPHTDIQFGARTVGMHGYSNTEPNMRPAFMARGPDFVHTVLDSFSSVDIYPMVCSLMKISHCQGTDGEMHKPQLIAKVPLVDNRLPPLDYKSLNQRQQTKKQNRKQNSASSYHLLSLPTLVLSILTLLKLQYSI